MAVGRGRELESPFTIIYFKIALYILTRYFVLARTTLSPKRFPLPHYRSLGMVAVIVFFIARIIVENRIANNPFLENEISFERVLSNTQEEQFLPIVPNLVSEKRKELFVYQAYPSLYFRIRKV